MKVAWLPSRIVIFRAPGFVGTPPSAMVISLPWGVRAVGAAVVNDALPQSPPSNYLQVLGDAGASVTLFGSERRFSRTDARISISLGMSACVAARSILIYPTLTAKGPQV